MLQKNAKLLSDVASKNLKLFQFEQKAPKYPMTMIRDLVLSHLKSPEVFILHYDVAGTLSIEAISAIIRKVIKINWDFKILCHEDFIFMDFCSESE